MRLEIITDSKIFNIFNKALQKNKEFEVNVSMINKIQKEISQ